MSGNAYHNDTNVSRNLPVPIGPARAKPSLKRLSPASYFVSHLIAEKQRVDVQRARNRSTPQIATSTYERGASITIKRMPAGYRLASTI